MTPARLPAAGEAWSARDSLARWTITERTDTPCRNGSLACLAAPPHTTVVDDYIGDVCPYYVASVADLVVDELSDDAVISLGKGA
jgi:hypothetical protein